jgi:hydroxyacylglutathione hydrolase
MFFFRQVLYRDLGCASYVLAGDGEAVVVDPRWDIDVYLEIAREEDLRIAYILDTHDHADHVSGRRRLAELTGARSYHAVVAGDLADDGIRPGEEIAIGDIRVRPVGAPGHRPEHIVFAVADLSRGTGPWMLLTGDSLLVGDLARPDLAVEAVDGASLLHASLGSLIELGDHVEVWPGHVGGSLCGGAGLSGKTSSTVGFERRHNPWLLADHDEFVRALTHNMPPRPPNVERIVAINRSGSTGPPAVAELAPGHLRELLQPNVSVLDARSPEAYDEGHLAGSVNLPVCSHGVGTRAGWSVAPDEDVIIVADAADVARRMVSILQAVGLWQIVGYVLGDRTAWERHGLPVTRSDAWDLDQLAGGLRRHEVDLVDVRDTSEWIAGHVPGSRHMPLDRLGAGRSVHLADNGRTTAVACAAGNRAAFAASLLRRAGHPNVVRVSGGGVADLGERGIGLDVGA